MTEILYKNRLTIARFFLVLLIFTGFLPFSVGVYSAKGPSSTQATTQPTTQATTDAQGIDDIDVSLKTGTDGKTKITIKGMDGDADSTWNTILTKYHGIIIGISAVAFLTFAVMFIINITSMAVNSKNPIGRTASLTACIWTGIATAIGGASTIITALAWNALK